jgi:hypothetical protein
MAPGIAVASAIVPTARFTPCCVHTGVSNIMCFPRSILYAVRRGFLKEYWISRYTTDFVLPNDTTLFSVKAG